jgi:hypothetical protein
MGSALSIRMLALPMATLAFGSISGTYAALGSPFTFPIRILYIANGTNGALTFSFDGVNDHFVVLNGLAFELNVTANRNMPQGFSIAQGTQVYVKGSPGSGNVYLSAFYGFTGNI